MTLEELLAPVKWIDEQVLRQYTKLATKWEDDKDILRNKYVLAHIFMTIGYMAVFPRIIEKEYIFNPILQWSYMGLAAHDLLDTINSFNSLLLNSVRKSKAISEATAVDKFTYFSRKIQRTVRLPLLTLGSLYFYSFGESIFNDAINWSSLDISSALVGLASSMYIKDSDPKLLQKEPFWKKVYDAIKEKANNLIPKPTPQPTPQLLTRSENHDY